MLLFWFINNIYIFKYKLIVPWTELKDNNLSQKTKTYISVFQKGKTMILSAYVHI